MDLQPFALLYLKKNERETALFAKRVPTLLKGETCYFAAGSSFRSTTPGWTTGKIFDPMFERVGRIRLTSALRMELSMRGARVRFLHPCADHRRV